MCMRCLILGGSVKIYRATYKYDTGTVPGTTTTVSVCPPRLTLKLKPHRNGKTDDLINHPNASVKKDPPNQTSGKVGLYDIVPSYRIGQKRTYNS